jgi:hypothetical protein
MTSISRICQLVLDTNTWYLDDKQYESPTEYNVDMVTLASRQLQSSGGRISQGSSKKQSAEPVQKQKKTNVAVSKIQVADSPAKNTRKKSKKRYYEEVDHDEDSEEEFKPPVEEDNSSGTTVEESVGKHTKTLTTMKVKLKKQDVARAGGVLDMTETDDELDDEIDQDDEDYGTQDNGEEDGIEELDLDVDAYEAVDNFEVEMLVKEGIYNIPADGEEATTEVDADEDAVVEVSIPVDPAEQRAIHKRDFYNLYQPYYKRTTNTHLITDAKYKEILRLLRTKPKTSERGNTRKLRQTYQLEGNVENQCIYRKGKRVTTFERVFDAILEAHSSIGHARDPRKHKDYLRDNLNYFGIPGPAVQMFINTCPTVSIVWYVYFYLINTVTNFICLIFLVFESCQRYTFYPTGS